MRFDKLASHNLLRARLLPRGESGLQSAALGAVIGAALTLLLIGLVYNVSLAFAVRRQFLAWHGAWAGCMLLWGLIWSEMHLIAVPAHGRHGLGPDLHVPCLPGGHARDGERRHLAQPRRPAALGGPGDAVPWGA